MHQLSKSAASRWALGAAVVGSALVWTTAFGSPQSSQTATAPQTSGPLVMAPTRAQAEFDQLFIDMMVPHHQGAVEMADIALMRAEYPEIRTLAVEISRSQMAEISQMQAWRLTWYGAPPNPTVLPDAPMNMPGMAHE